MPADNGGRRYTVVAGLGGRPVLKDGLRAVFTDAVHDRLDPLTFRNLDRDAIAGRMT